MEQEYKTELHSFEGNSSETTMTSLDDMLLESLEQATYRSSDQECFQELTRIVSENTAVDLAIVTPHLPLEFRYFVYESLDGFDAKAEFIISTNRATRRALFKKLSDDHIRKVIEEMASDEAVYVLDELPEARYRILFSLLDPEKAENIKELQQYEFDTAGRLMTNEFFSFSRTTTIGAAAAYIRNHPNIDFTRSFFVVDDAGKLEGYVPARNFVISPATVQLRQIMKPIIYKVSPEASPAEIIDIVERYSISTLPIVEDGELLGIITHDDVVEMMEEVADDTIAQIAGTVEEIGEHESLFKRLVWRAPWLIVTLCSGFAMATTLSSLQNMVWFAMAYFFVPLITGMSGNVGIQCSTILVRSMAMGELSKGNQRSTIIRELTLASFIGLIFGCAGALVVYGLHLIGFHPVPGETYVIASIVGSGIFGACITAGTLGVFSPFFFARVGVDPAVASGPIVTACNDFCSMLMFCIIAHTLSTFLIG